MANRYVAFEAFLGFFLIFSYFSCTFSLEITNSVYDSLSFGHNSDRMFPSQINLRKLYICLLHLKYFEK